MANELRVIEICAGAGGQALGLERAGFGHELAVELDVNALNTLRHNRPTWHVALGDVADTAVWKPSDYSPSARGEAIDLLAGGVPCPPFSIAGKQLGAGDERDLFAWAVEQAAVIQPRAVLLENVRGLSMPRFAGYRQHVLERFREFGYVAEWRLLHASDFGVPQLRPRFVLVAMKPDDFAHFHWPTPFGEVTTVGQALLSLMSANGWKGAANWAARANHIGPTIVGGSKKHGGADLGPTRAKRAWAALGVDGRGVANDAPHEDDNFEIGPKLTCEMVARLQGWSPEFPWEFTGKKTSVYRQIGNAFPPPVAYELGMALASALQRTSQSRVVDEVPDVDPIYRALKTSGKFLTAAQLMKISGVILDGPEFDRRIDLLNRDFEILKQTRKTELVYKLGSFRAFTGQADHFRHEYLRASLSKVS
ncbi:DNA cytosine methyltransferase [Arthrobacter sp. 135MFCol5.1]|uniref:DNA cytosine methyltransferase n=1 Tax=Arthrobacter sp. 135MFCol5.1 TaxID=1158050 RepID=UPI0003A443D2|nr:DNA (cytosine-5-)-methyltransferase [Arthrobacter sp. 135MFCol5.1]